MVYLNAPGAHYVDHLARQIHYLDGTAHLQDVDAVRVDHGTRLQYQRDGLGGDHEIARHLRVGYCHRPPGLYLPPEGRNHAPPAPQHVPKPNRSIKRLRVLLGRRAHEHLRKALGRPHDVYGVNSLIGRDVNELLRPELPGSARHDQGTANIVGDGLGGVQFHERDVLVGGGVEDQMGPEAVEEGAGLLRVRHVAHHQLAAREARAGELLVQIVEGALVAVEEDQAGGAEA